MKKNSVKNLSVDRKKELLNKERLMSSLNFSAKNKHLFYSSHRSFNSSK